MKLLLVAVVVLGLWSLSGCVMAHGPVTGGICIDEKGPVSMGDAKGGTKVGIAIAEGIIIVGYGDASISAAMKAGGISRVCHVDNQTMNILGVYAKYQTIVYGD